MVYLTLDKQNIDCFHLQEHKPSIQNQEINKSAVAQHCRVNGHIFNFQSNKSICKPNSTFELDFLEAVHTYKNHNNVINCGFCHSSFIRLLEN